MNITQTIEYLILSYRDDLGLTAKKINGGECMNFADYLVNAGFGQKIWGDEIPIEQWSNDIQYLDENEASWKDI